MANEDNIIFEIKFEKKTAKGLEDHTKILKKFGFYKIIFISTVVQGLCITAMLEFLNPYNLAVWFFILGMMGGLTWMTMDTWVNVVSNNSNRGKSIGIYNSSVTTGLAMGPLIVGLFGTSGRIPITVCLILVLLKIGSLISIKKYVNLVSIPEQSTKMKFSIILISPFVFLAIFFAGIDFIDQKLKGDINVTSPTGLKTLYDFSYHSPD